VENKNVNNGNWVSRKLIISISILLIIFISLSGLFVVNIVIGIIFIFFSVLFAIFLIYFLYAHYQFSPKGKDIQNKIYNLIMNQIDFTGNGSIIDIGCGNASLIIKLALKYPNAVLTGIDYWVGMWDYSKKDCEKNVENSGVNNEITFIKASASALPFKNNSFDLAVSNFVFHEVKDVRDKKDIIKEALRVVKKNGVFVFHDLFLLKSFYGNIDEFLNELKSSGIQKIEFIKTKDSSFIPRLLKLPFMVGSIGIIKGVK